MDLYTRLFLAPSISYIETIHDRKYSPELKISPTIVNEVRRIDFQVISLFTSSFYMKKGKHTCIFYIKFFFSDSRRLLGSWTKHHQFGRRRSVWNRDREWKPIQGNARNKWIEVIRCSTQRKSVLRQLRRCNWGE